MMIIKNIIKATIATTAVISSAFAMVLPGNALSPVTYKAASNYKLLSDDNRHFPKQLYSIIMQYTIAEKKKQAPQSVKLHFVGLFAVILIFL